MIQDTQLLNLDLGSFHLPPDGYSYEFQRSRYKDIIGIWICNDNPSTVTGQYYRSIWGFYHPRKRCYYSPINSTTKGNQVAIDRTTPYSAMVPNLNPLEIALYGGV